jgi:hypothetical protein
MHRFVLQNMRAPDPLPRVSLSQGVLNVEQVAGDTRHVLALICLKNEDEACFTSADEKHVRQWDGRAPGFGCECHMAVAFLFSMKSKLLIALCLASPPRSVPVLPAS